MGTSFISSLASEMEMGITCELSRALYLGATGSMTYRKESKKDHKSTNKEEDGLTLRNKTLQELKNVTK